MHKVMFPCVYVTVNLYTQVMCVKSQLSIHVLPEISILPDYTDRL